MASSPAALTVIRGRGAAWPTQAYTTAGPAAVGLFDGSEVLTAQVFYGDDAVVATVTAGWIDPGSGQYLISISKTTSATLAAGSYTLVVTADRGPIDGALIEVTLIVEPAPGDDAGSLRSLAQPGDFLALVPSQAGNPAVAGALKGATRTIEAFCRRPLVLGAHDRTHRPGRTRKIYLDAWPVQGEVTLTHQLLIAGLISNVDTLGNQQAAVSLVPVPGTQRAGSLVLSWTASGVASSVTLDPADYTTIADLLDAVSAIGSGWSTTSPGSANTSNDLRVVLLPPSRLLCRPGRFGAVGRQVELYVYGTEMANYVVDPDRGVIELLENLPEAFRYSDRAFGLGWGFAWAGAAQPRHAGVRAQYRGGYATAQADLALGYEAVPADLMDACCLTAQTILSAGPLAGIIKSQTTGTRKYELRADASAIPLAARPLLAKYVNHGIGGWGQ